MNTGRLFPVGGLALLGCLLPLCGCVVHPSGPHGPACAAIEAATAVELSSERLALLERVARRSNLSQHEQTYLVNAIVFGGIGGEHADALIALLKNPCCTEETRRYIAKQLRFVSYSSERRRIAEVLGAQEDAASRAGEQRP